MSRNFSRPARNAATAISFAAFNVAGKTIQDASLAVLSLEPWGFGPDGKLFNDVSGILGGAELISNGAVLDFSSKKLWLRSVR